MFSVILSLLVTSLSILYLQKIAKNFDLVDYPGGRKQHCGNVPLVGGIAIFIGLLTSIPIFIDMNFEFTGILIASFFILTLGVIDDIKGLSARTKLLFQVATTIFLIIFSNIIVLDVGNLFGFGKISLSYFSGTIFTCIAVAGLINSFNMIDGLDGLSGSLILSQLISILILCTILNTQELNIILLTLIGATTSFLLFNFPIRKLSTKKVFLGDAGSMLMGLLICSILIKISQSTAQASAILMVWIVSIPLMDATRLIIFRLMNKQSPFSPNRDHIHHLLLDLGLSQKNTVKVLALSNLFISFIGMSLYIFGVADYILFYLFIVIFGLYLYATRKISKVKY